MGEAYTFVSYKILIILEEIFAATLQLVQRRTGVGEDVAGEESWFKKDELGRERERETQTQRSSAGRKLFTVFTTPGNAVGFPFCGGSGVVKPLRP